MHELCIVGLGIVGSCILKKHNLDFMMISQCFQNSKLVMSFQYLKKEVRDEVYFLHANISKFPAS